MGTNAKIGRIAQLCHEANRAYCQLIGDDSQLPYHSVSDEIIASAENGVENILNGKIRSPQQSHENWMEFKRKDGWTYGPTKDATLKEHPCFVPYEELPEEQRIKDYIFFSIVKAHEEL